ARVAGEVAARGRAGRRAVRRRGAHVAAGAAVLGVAGGVDAVAVAVGRRGGHARRHARAVRADLVRPAVHAAGAAVVLGDQRVHAGAAARGEGRVARDAALAVLARRRAVGGRRAGVVAGAAVPHVVLEIEAGVAALGEARVAGEPAAP